MSGDIDTIRGHLGEEADYLLNFNDAKINKENLHLPGSDFVDRIFPKSQWMTGEIKKNLSQFLKSIPIRFITKSYHIAHELTDIL